MGVNPNPAVVIVPVITGCYVAYYLQGGATPFDPVYTNQVVFPTCAGFYNLVGANRLRPNSNTGPDPDYNPVGK